MICPNLQNLEIVFMIKSYQNIVIPNLGETSGIKNFVEILENCAILRLDRRRYNNVPDGGARGAGVGYHPPPSRAPAIATTVRPLPADFGRAF